LVFKTGKMRGILTMQGGKGDSRFFLDEGGFSGALPASGSGKGEVEPLNSRKKAGLSISKGGGIRP